VFGTETWSPLGQKAAPVPQPEQHRTGPNPHSGHGKRGHPGTVLSWGRRPPARCCGVLSDGPCSQAVGGAAPPAAQGPPSMGSGRDSYATAQADSFFLLKGW